MIGDIVENGDLSLDELYWHADEFCRKWWGISFTGRIELINRKWRCYYGKFHYRTDDPSASFVRMSRKTNAERTKDEVLRTLLHELVHWRNFMTGLPFDDTDDEFIRECIRVGASISGTQSAQAAYKRFIGNNETTNGEGNE